MRSLRDEENAGGVAHVLAVKVDGRSGGNRAKIERSVGRSRSRNDLETGYVPASIGDRDNSENLDLDLGLE